ncbi:hypothetical protein [uncultured Amnibacterium sp.]|uniref:hypothetical protein n=1 Tax=uncultured Amnibacterium sp. TaxID=1631851 RepID=UPI0035CB7F46
MRAEPGRDEDAEVLSSRFVFFDRLCLTCGAEMMPVVLDDGEIADLCTDCEAWSG